MILRGMTCLRCCAQPGFHLMADQGLDLKDFAFRRSVGTCTRGIGATIFCLTPNGCQAQPLVATSTQVLVINSVPSLSSAKARTIAAGQGGSVSTREVGSAGDEVKGDDFGERIAWRQHTNILHMVLFSHRAVDVETERHGVAVRKGSRHHEAKAISTPSGVFPVSS